jgi:hypothetical protein
MVMAKDVLRVTEPQTTITTTAGAAMREGVMAAGAAAEAWDEMRPNL